MFDPLSSTTTGYHLFFEPVSDVESEVSTLIRELSEEYNAPVFPPHVTFLSRIPADNQESLIQKTAMLANELSSFTLTLEKFKAENAYFRALYIQIQEQDKMLALHKHASNVFSMDANPAYKAHVSLLYGNYPQELKEASMKSLSMPSTRNFLVNSIHLYRTEGETSDWYRVQEFKFSR